MSIFFCSFIKLSNVFVFPDPDPPNREIEFAPVYFNSSTKPVTNHRYKLDKSFQEILYRIDAWINKRSGWIIESIESQYINITTYKPLAGSSYIDLPIELRSLRKKTDQH